jgi:hypothetical protein
MSESTQSLRQMGQRLSRSGSDDSFGMQARMSALPGCSSVPVINSTMKLVAAVQLGVWQGKLPGTAISARITQSTLFLMNDALLRLPVKVKSISSRLHEQKKTCQKRRCISAHAPQNQEIGFLLRFLSILMSLNKKEYSIFSVKRIFSALRADMAVPGSFPCHTPISCFTEENAHAIDVKHAGRHLARMMGRCLRDCENPRR